MKNVIFCLICLWAILSCSSISKQPGLSSKTYQDFHAISLESSGLLAGKWGQPKSKDTMNIGLRHFEVWRYDNTEFLIDSATDKVVEKTYFPPVDSNESRLQYLLQNDFRQIPFDKIPVKCRHFNELILMSKNEDIFLVTSDQPEAKVEVIAFTSPPVARLRVQENSTVKCRL
jgi:hypothetical protein